MYAKKEGTYEDFPIVVLVNRFSASASEIVAACLQDHERAIVIGERTWGKGSVQNIIELEGGRSALKLTTAGYQRPNGRNINRFEGATEDDEWGVKPNAGFEVKLSDAELRQLIDERRERDIVKKRGADDADLPARSADKQLSRALDYLAEKLRDPPAADAVKPEKTAAKPTNDKPSDGKPAGQAADPTGDPAAHQP